MNTSNIGNNDGSNCHSLPSNGSNCHSLPRSIRVSISKPQHIELLRSVSAQVGSLNLKDGLDHILNCRLAGDIPAGSKAIQIPLQTAIVSSHDVDEFAGLLSFED